MHVTDRLLKARESAALMNVSLSSFWRRVADGTIIKPVKIGSLSRWPESEIMAAIQAAKIRRSAEPD